MHVMEKEREFLKVEITPQMKEELRRLYESRGLTQIEAGSRLIRWFMVQDEIVQQAIFGQLPQKLKNEARRLLIDGVIPLPIEDVKGQDAALDEAIQGTVRKRKGA